MYYYDGSLFLNSFMGKKFDCAIEQLTKLFENYGLHLELTFNLQTNNLQHIILYFHMAKSARTAVYTVSISAEG